MGRRGVRLLGFDNYLIVRLLFPSMIFAIFLRTSLQIIPDGALSAFLG